MRIGELSERTGVPAATIKYYLREHLLPSGVHGEGNTVEYGPEHVHRLLLIRALSETAGLSVAQIGEVLTILARHPESAFQAMGAALAATHREPKFSLASEGTTQAAERTVDALLEEYGWAEVAPPMYRDALVTAMAAYYRLGNRDPQEVLGHYADAAAQLASADMEAIAEATGEGGVNVEQAVIGTVLGETVLAALRRIAHIAASARIQEERGPSGTMGS
ncbi:MerR family transcriptional regulator [Glycomyces buryatensis]|uniref:MerR family transcriptional regulator n=1 Tax=Glycomyces buryatensis TaxID=2570927 RepID=A0A4S8Q646_9ACTN|nr:MerR family transcriptional regulator [Glycomyces buryatensis]THV35744.1 MerR family transcriptional regulator [Glycomyces buryatensis]